MKTLIISHFTPEFIQSPDGRTLIGSCSQGGIGLRENSTWYCRNIILPDNYDIFNKELMGCGAQAEKGQPGRLEAFPPSAGEKSGDESLRNVEALSPQ
jgi:hypothetical protein